MVRVIKRYESRKLYDTEESRYVSLEEIAGWIRDGQEVRVVDNSSSEDVTAQTLIQIISEEGRRGASFLSTDLLHQLIRRGREALTGGVEQLREGVDRVLEASVSRLGPVRQVRQEMATLLERLEQLERSLTAIERQERKEPRKKKTTAAGARSGAGKSAKGRSAGAKRASTAGRKGDRE